MQVPAYLLYSKIGHKIMSHKVLSKSLKHVTSQILTNPYAVFVTYLILIKALTATILLNSNIQVI